MKKKSFTLLTQQEIDTLVNFLVDKKDDFTNEVMSQDSIDKLISIIRGNVRNKFRLDISQAELLYGEKLLVSLEFCTEGQECELMAEKNSENQYLELTAVNKETGRALKVTPENFVKHNLEPSSATWGKAIFPAAFNEVAEVFGLRYTKDTYNFICDIFSEVNYGEKGIEVPEVFLPDADQLVDNMIE